MDIKLLGHPVARFVNTHLESAASGYRQLQAGELVGPTGPLTNPNLAAHPRRRPELGSEHPVRR